MKKIRKCTECGSYSLRNRHCNRSTVSAHPPPFNPNDPYGKYRRLHKKL